MDSNELLVIASVEDHGATATLTKLGTGIAALDKTSSDLNDTLNTQSVGAFSGFKQRVSDLGVATEGLRGKIGSLANTVGTTLVHGMKYAAIGMVGLVAATGALTYETEKTYAQFKNVILNFTGGNQALTTQLYNQAKQYNDIVSISSQQTGLKNLLTNPQYRSQAGGINTALLKIAAASGPTDAGTMYGQLTSAVGRMEDSEKISSRVILSLQKSGVNMAPFYKQFGFNVTPNSPLTATAAQQYVEQVGSSTELLNYLKTYSNSSQINQAITRTRATPAGAFNKLKADLENSIDDVSGSFDKAIVKMLKPLTGLLAGKGGLIETLAPPLVGFVTSLAMGLEKLLPVLSPFMKALATFFSKAIAAITPAFGRLQPIATKLGVAFYKFLAAFIPVMPALVNALVTIMGTLPAMTPALVTFAKILADLMKLGASFVSFILKIPGAKDLTGGVLGAAIAGLAGLWVVLKLYAAGDAVWKGLKMLGTALQGIGKFFGIGGAAAEDTAGESLTTAGTSLQAAAGDLTAAAEKLGLGSTGPGGALGPVAEEGTAGIMTIVSSVFALIGSVGLGYFLAKYVNAHPVSANSPLGKINTALGGYSGSPWVPPPGYKQPSGADQLVGGSSIYANDLSRLRQALGMPSINNPNQATIGYDIGSWWNDIFGGSHKTKALSQQQLAESIAEAFSKASISRSGKKYALDLPGIGDTTITAQQLAALNNSKTSGQEMTLIIQEAHFHDVQDLPTLRKALTKYATDKAVRGAPKPNDWSSLRTDRMPVPANGTVK